MRRSGIALGGRPDDNRPIHGRAAHARIPGGPETLVILEGLTLENKAPTGRALWLPRWAHKRYTRDYTVYQVARRPGLPAGHTTRDMADDYASWIGGQCGQCDGGSTVGGYGKRREADSDCEQAGGGLRRITDRRVPLRHLVHVGSAGSYAVRSA